MNLQVQLQPAFVLHTRPYRDSSLLVDILSRDFGRMTLVARGQRQSKARSRRPLQPFAALLLSWQGRGELKTLVSADAEGPPRLLAGNFLFSGMYANELLIRLLPPNDAQPEIFQSYCDLLEALGRGDDLEVSLRTFEFQLLDHLGYGINFESEGNSGEAIVEQGVYNWLNEAGFVRSERHSEAGFLGRDLLAIGSGDYQQAETRRAAKRLARMALAPHLGSRPLKSRELFR